MNADDTNLKINPKPTQQKPPITGCVQTIVETDNVLTIEQRVEALETAFGRVVTSATAQALAAVGASHKAPGAAMAPDDKAGMRKEKNILEAKCRKPECAHRWTVAYLPMAIEDVAACGKRAICPKCADTKPLLAID